MGNVWDVQLMSFLQLVTLISVPRSVCSKQSSWNPKFSTVIVVAVVVIY